MSIQKFNIGDLVYRRNGRDKNYWKGRVGTIVYINYVHGDPRIGVKWSRIEQIRSYEPNGLEKIK